MDHLNGLLVPRLSVVLATVGERYPRMLQYFEHIEEMEWAINVCKETSLPVAATMCIGPDGDLHGVSTGECAVRMAVAG